MNPGSERVIYAAAEPREAIARGLAAAGFPLLEEARNGLVALDRATREPPALLVLEAELPGLKGVEICRVLRGLTTMPPVPMVLVADDWAAVRSGAPWTDDAWVAPRDASEVEARLTLLRARLERFDALRDERDRCHTLAHVDPLTSLPNRRALDAELTKALATARAHDAQLAILLLDVDRFKAINDRWGHPTGDRVLEEIAGVLRRSSRRRDVFGRYGGEEFLYLLPGHSLDAAVQQAERIRAELARHPFEAPDEAVNLTVSIGVASATPDDTAHTVLERADRLLYEAKRTGRNCVVAPNLGALVD